MERLYNTNSLSFQVFDELEKQIIHGNLTPGLALTENKLCEQFSVSRTPIREALRMLEQKGLVQITPNKGAVVLGISVKDLTDIYTIRMYVEGLASRWAAQNITDEQLAQLREVVELQEFYQNRDCNEQINDLDTRFHELIYEYSNSRTLQHTLSNLHHMILHYRQRSFAADGRAPKAIKEHRDILNALEEHNANEAERLTALHIGNAQANLLGLIKKVQ